MKKTNSKKLSEQYDSMASMLNHIKSDIVAGEPEEDERLKWLMDKDYRNGVFEKEPKCILVIRTIGGSDLPLVPVCNRMAAYDEKIIQLGLRLAKEFKSNENVDQDHLDSIIGSLKRSILLKDIAK